MKLNDFLIHTSTDSMTKSASSSSSAQEELLASVEEVYRRADSLLSAEKKASIDAVAFQDAFKIRLNSGNLNTTEISKEASDGKKALLAALLGGAVYGGWAGYQHASEVHPEDRSRWGTAIVGALGNVPAGLVFRGDTKDYRSWQKAVQNKTPHRRDYTEGEYAGEQGKPYNEAVDYSPAYQSGFREGSVSNFASEAEDNPKIRHAYALDNYEGGGAEQFSEDIEQPHHNPKLSRILDKVSKREHKKSFEELHPRNAPSVLRKFLKDPETAQHLEDIYNSRTKNREIASRLSSISTELQNANQMQRFDRLTNRGQYSR